MKQSSFSISKRLYCTLWNASNYRVFSGPYFPAFGLNTGKHGPQKTPYLDTFHAVLGLCNPRVFLLNYFFLKVTIRWKQKYYEKVTMYFCFYLYLRLSKFYFVVKELASWLLFKTLCRGFRKLLPHKLFTYISIWYFDLT